MNLLFDDLIRVLGPASPTHKPRDTVLFSFVNPDPVGSVTFSWIRIRNFFLSDPEPGKNEKTIIKIVFLFCFNCTEKTSVVEPDPHGSGTIAWIRIQN